MEFRKRFSFRGNKGQFRAVLHTYACAMNTEFEEVDKNSVIAKLGDRLSLNPNTVYSKITVNYNYHNTDDEVGEVNGAVEFSGDAFLWMRNKMKKIQELRAEAFTAFLDNTAFVNTSDEESAERLKKVFHFPLYTFKWNDVVDLAFKYFSLFVSVSLVLLAALCSAWILGVKVVEDYLVIVKETGTFAGIKISGRIQEYLFEPSSAVPPGIFVGFAAGFAMGIAFALLLVILEFVDFLSNITTRIIAVVFVFAVTWFAFPFGIKTSLSSIGILFVAGYLAYSLTWSLRYRKLYFTFTKTGNNIVALQEN